MKYIKILSLSLLLLSALGTVKADEKELPASLTKTEAGFTFEKVVDLPGVTKEQAYDRVKQWVLNTLKTADNNIGLDDKDKNSINTSTALLLGKVQFAIVYNAVDFKINFSFKENKMRITASQFVYHGREMNNEITTTAFDKIKGIDYTKKVMRIIYEKFDEQFPALIASAETAAKKKDDW